MQMFGFSILYLFAAVRAADRRARLRRSSSGAGCEAAWHDRTPLDGAVADAAQLRNRRLRNIAIGLSVGFLAALFYAITIVKLGPGRLAPAL